MSRPDFEPAWREFSDKLGWLQGNRAVPSRYLGWHVADIVNDLIDRAYPGLREGKAAFPADQPPSWRWVIAKGRHEYRQANRRWAWCGGPGFCRECNKR